MGESFDTEFSIKNAYFCATAIYGGVACCHKEIQAGKAASISWVSFTLKMQ